MATSEVNSEPPENKEGAPPEEAQREEDESHSNGINDSQESNEEEEDTQNDGQSDAEDQNQNLNRNQNENQNRDPDGVDQESQPPQTEDQEQQTEDQQQTGQQQEQSEQQTEEEKEEQRLQEIKERVENLDCYPPFTDEELWELTIKQLKEIMEYWGLTWPTRARKASLIAKIRDSPCNIAPGWVTQLRNDDLPLPVYSEETLRNLSDDDVAKISGIIWPKDDGKEYTADELRKYLLGFKQDFSNKNLNNVGAAIIADFVGDEDD